MNLHDFLSQIERSIIEAAYLASNKNVTITARLLEMNRTTLYEKLISYCLKTRVKNREEVAGKDRGRIPDRNRSWATHKKMLIMEALERNEYSRSRAADELGVSVRTVRYMIVSLKKDGIDIPNSSPANWRNGRTRKKRCTAN